MADKAVVMIVSGRGGVPTIPEPMQGKPGLQDCAGECTGSMYKYMGKTFTPEALRAGHNPGKSKSQKKLDAAMSEVHRHIPSTVEATGKTGAAKAKMLAAVAFSKARAQGARLPRKGK